MAVYSRLQAEDFFAFSLTTRDFILEARDAVSNGILTAGGYDDLIEALFTEATFTGKWDTNIDDLINLYNFYNSEILIRNEKLSFFRLFNYIIGDPPAAITEPILESLKFNGLNYFSKLSTTPGFIDNWIDKITILYNYNTYFYQKLSDINDVESYINKPPSQIARTQIAYDVPLGSRMYVFDLGYQRIYNYSFSYDNLRKFDSVFSERPGQQNGQLYQFLNDQVVYDSQLEDFAFEKPLLTFEDSLSNENTRAESKEIMRKNYWLKRFAEKLFLIVFRANHLQPKPKVLFGFEMKNLRENKVDQNKWY